MMPQQGDRVRYYANNPPVPGARAGMNPPDPGTYVLATVQRTVDGGRRVDVTEDDTGQAHTMVPFLVRGETAPPSEWAAAG